MVRVSDIKVVKGQKLNLSEILKKVKLTIDDIELNPKLVYEIKDKKEYLESIVPTSDTTIRFKIHDGIESLFNALRRVILDEIEYTNLTAVGISSPSEGLLHQKAAASFQYIKPLLECIPPNI